MVPTRDNDNIMIFADGTFVMYPMELPFIEQALQMMRKGRRTLMYKFTDYLSSEKTETLTVG